MSPFKVLISTSSFGAIDAAPLVRLREHGIRPELNPRGRTLTEEEIASLVGEVDGLLAGTEPLNERVLTRAGRLKVISRVGVGIDNVDLGEAARRGIAVFTTQNSHTHAVAELTLGGMLGLLRHVPQMHEALRVGRWHRPMGTLLNGKTVGFVGLGRVGKCMVELLRPFGVSLLAFDVRPDAGWAAAHDVQLVTLHELLARADIVSIHAAKEQISGYLLGAAEIALLKPGSYLVNTARGGLVDEAALHQALAAGRLRGAYLDTFECEPYDGPLRELPNVVLTPHAGSYAAEARVRMEVEAVDNLLDWLRGKGDA